ncbi:hypothetical protein ACFVH6_38035 [Spirillospora sp. NPDC127200]
MLLRHLHELGAEQQAAVLRARSSAASRSTTILGVVDGGERFQFGREPDGTPAEPRGWDDLD